MKTQQSTQTAAESKHQSIAARFKMAAAEAKKGKKKADKKAAPPAAPKKEKAAKAEPNKPAAAKPRETVQSYACQLLMDEFDVNKVLAAVLKKFPEAKTSLKCIYWYRSRMNRGLM